MFKIKGFKARAQADHSENTHDRNYDSDDYDYVHTQLEKKALKKNLKKIITHKHHDKQQGRLMRMAF